MIAAGHSGALDYSVRQAVAFWHLLQKRKRRELALRVRLDAIAANGDRKQIEAATKQLEKE